MSSAPVPYRQRDPTGATSARLAPRPALWRVAACAGVALFLAQPAAASDPAAPSKKQGGNAAVTGRRRRRSAVALAAGGSGVAADGGVLALTAPARCRSVKNLTTDHIEQSLALGKRFLLSSQLAEGNFRYEYDWKRQKDSLDDSSVRQAGTLWALVLLHKDAPDPELAAAIRKAIAYFAKRSHDLPGGHRILRYPGEKAGKLGTLALIALSHVDFLRQEGAVPPGGDEHKELEKNLRGYLKQILRAEDEDQHLLRGLYSLEDGSYKKKKEKISPYYNGESLLVLSKWAQQLPDEEAQELWERIGRISKAGAVHVMEAEKNDDWKWLKGYYQWSSMAWHELLQTGKPQFQEYSENLLQYAEYVVQKHSGKADRGRRFNKGVILEGLHPAIVEAQQRGDARGDKFRCWALRGLRSMVQLQVGHALVAPEVADGRHQAVAIGGFQGNAKTPKLRIDTTQHSMHAVLQAKRMLHGQRLI